MKTNAPSKKTPAKRKAPARRVKTADYKAPISVHTDPMTDYDLAKMAERVSASRRPRHENHERGDFLRRLKEEMHVDEINMANGSKVTWKVPPVNELLPDDKWVSADDDEGDQPYDPSIPILPAVQYGGDVGAPVLAPPVVAPVQAVESSASPIKHVERILIADLPVKPRFQMGIEFEGMVRDDIYRPFIKAVQDLGTDDEDNLLITVGNDPSIRDIPPGYTDVEIRTETVGSRTGVRLLEELLCFLYIASQTGDFLTNHSCGFHINISEKGVWENDQAIDYYAHVLRLFDETGVLARFGRLGTPHGTKYCRPFFKDGDDRDVKSIKHKYQLCKRREQAARARGSEVNQQIKESKYFAVALRDSPAHEDYEGSDEIATRIEFRCIGNEGYHLRFDDLDESINHLISCVRMAYRETVS